MTDDAFAVFAAFLLSALGALVLGPVGGLVGSAVAKPRAMPPPR